MQLWAGLGSSLLGQAAAAHHVEREGSGSRGMRIVTFLIPAVEPPSRVGVDRHEARGAPVAVQRRL